MKKLFLLASVALFSLTAVAQTTEALAVGTDAPKFSGKSNTGKFNLKRATKDGSVVVLFYRGSWCPYCSKQLKGLNDSLQMLKDKGASVVAITPEISAGVDKTVEKTKASFPIIGDKNLKIAKAYKVNYAMDEATKKKYQSYGMDMDKINGANGYNLPVPALYIIGKDGKIKYAYFNEDYCKRPSVATLLENL